MRGQSPLLRTARGLRLSLRPQSAPTYVCRQCRAIQISAAPTTDAPRAGGDAFGAPADTRDSADARFEVLGAPYSLLSVSLSASQNLYTRRGTLVAVAGKPENAQSTLSILNPTTRVLLGVPFLYQRISATAPITALISTKSPTTSFSVLHLDGTTDWMISQRNALLAWTGHTLSPSTRIQRNLSLAHWGSTHLTGRGLAALSAPGQIYKLTLQEGEEFVAHPGSVVAYSVSRSPPQPFRFKSSSLRLQVPSLTRWIPESEFMTTVRNSEPYKFALRIFYSLRTMTRRTIWGDRLFLQFHGPSTILMSSRGVRVSDTLSKEQVDEIADAPAGVLADALDLSKKPKALEAGETAKKVEIKTAEPVKAEQSSSAIHVTTTKQDGKVAFEDSKGLKEFIQ
ncbi:mitochondrial biogenesis AIM24-domain-containing protein [Dactylonectria estremocensis]|uniref:Altered inheritance of mitochondria protein 24, mitochondrial n=1 Tax=Dactylonectria estremocensis TaxID=1079267 RepID=A0A9P9F6M8_9HYPO|nr:mitochondrial biogenesis AIM24-domain-containing protein [Dactylonectria estremocensis]